MLGGLLFDSGLRGVGWVSPHPVMHWICGVFQSADGTSHSVLGVRDYVRKCVLAFCGCIFANN